MFSTARIAGLATAILGCFTGVASAWERAPAPIEFATRAARPVAAAPAPARPRVAPVSAPAQRAASTSLDTTEMLYGYGRVSSRNLGPLLDLRGLQREGGAADVLAPDAFDDVAPVVIAETHSAAPPLLLASASEPAPVEAVFQAASAPIAATSGGYFLQIGAFADPSNAERVRTALLDVGTVTVDVREGPSVTLHRVRLGNWASRAEAELARDMVAERGFVGAAVAVAR